MKLKSTLLVLSWLLAPSICASAASMIISNVVNGPGDTLFASANIPLNGGLVVMGYFPAGITDADINTVPKLLANLGSFTTVTSAVPGSPSATLGGAFPGYVDQADFTSMGLVTPTNQETLLGRVIYEILTTATTLADAGGYAMVKIGTLLEDGPIENQYFGNPAKKTPILGTLGSVTGDFGAGYGTYKTINSIPEPFTTLLGAIGAIASLRRRRW